MPRIPEENYWFRRHEVAYEYIGDFVDKRDVLEAGSGEGLRRRPAVAARPQRHLRRLRLHCRGAHPRPLPAA